MDETRVAKAFCARMDHGGCGVLVEISGGRITGIKGDPDCTVNYGKLCPKGRAAAERIYHPDRLTTPLKRSGSKGSGKWTEITWDDALDTIALKIKGYSNEFGAQSILLAQGAPRGLEYLFTYRLAAALGTPNVITTGAVCFAPRWGAALMTCGFYPKPDIEHSKCILAWGNNAMSTSADFTMGFQLQKAIKKGTTMIVVDPFESTVARKADLWLRIKPGTDAALALGILHVILKEGLEDKLFVDKWVSGFNRLKKQVEAYPPDKVSEITWIPVDQIEEAARLYATAKPASLLWGNGVEHNINSVQVSRALISLMTVSGNLGSKGGNFEFPESSLTSPRDFILAGRLKEARKNMIGAEYPLAKMLGFVPSSAAVRAILENEPYPVKMMVVHNSNPMVSYANSQKVFEALNKLDFLVVSDLFMTPTAALADVVLPAATNYEFNDLGFYGLPWGSVHARPKLIEPVGQCWSDIKILNELAKRLDLGEYFWDDVDESLEYILRPSGLDYNSLKETLVIDESKDEKYRKISGFHTRSGKIELYSKALEKWRASPLPEFKEPVLPDERYPYLITSNKDLPFFHTALRNIPSLRKISPKPMLQIHPETATACGLQDGDVAVIETETGSITQSVKINESIDSRVVYADYGWWFAEKGSESLYGWEESNINVITDDRSSVEPLIGTTTQRGMYCNIKKA